MSTGKPVRIGNAKLNDEKEYTGAVENPGGKSYALGECVFFVWSQSDGQKTIEEISRKFKKNFEVLDDDPEEIVCSIVEKLEEMDLIS